jgi:hypothetical protein
MSRKNISLHDEIDRRAEVIIAKRGFAGLSDMIAVLVREEYERRGFEAGELKETPIIAAQQAANDKAAANVVKASYLKSEKPAAK